MPHTPTQDTRMDLPPRTFFGAAEPARDQVEYVNRSLRPLNMMTKALGLVRLPYNPTDTIFGWANAVILVVTLAISAAYLPRFVQVHLNDKDFTVMSLVNCAWWSSIHVVGLVNMLVPAAKRRHLEEIVACLFGRVPGSSGAADWLGEGTLEVAWRWSWLFALLAPFLFVLLLYNQLFCDENPFNELDSVHFLAVDYFLVSALVTESQLFLVLYIAYCRFATLNRGLVIATGIKTALLGDSDAERVVMIAPVPPHGDVKKPGADPGALQTLHYPCSATVSGLAYAHLFLSRATKHVNKAYGVQIFVTSAFRLFNLTIGFYYSLIVWTGVEKVEEFWLVMLQVAIWLTFYEISFFAIILMCEAVRKQARLTPMLVSEALIILEDQRIRRELHLFSRQLLHTEVNFSACEFFELNLGLLASMLASVVTYLVILVQFQLES